ncbi:MAG: hypothetical protein QHH13_05515, partial [Melioribacter sp.]|nr:hypothetical protein [Melioribacter sp.]
ITFSQGGDKMTRAESRALKRKLNKEIAEFIGISDDTLVRNYENFLLKGRSKLKIKLRRKIIEVALRGNVAMLIFLAKNFLQMTDEEKQKIEVRIKTIDKIENVQN